MIADSPVLLVTAIIYLLSVFGAGIWGYFKNQTEEDFLDLVSHAIDGE